MNYPNCISETLNLCNRMQANINNIIFYFSETSKYRAYRLMISYLIDILVGFDMLVINSCSVRTHHSKVYFTDIIVIIILSASKAKSLHKWFTTRDTQIVYGVQTRTSRH